MATLDMCRLVANRSSAFDNIEEKHYSEPKEGSNVAFPKPSGMSVRSSFLRQPEKEIAMRYDHYGGFAASANVTPTATHATSPPSDPSYYL